MLAHRIAGILRQYPNPEVAFFATEVLLATPRGRYRPVSSGYLIDPERRYFDDNTSYFVTGREMLQRDLSELGADIPTYIQGCIEGGKWYADQHIDVNTGTEILAPWVARIVNRWLKDETLIVVQDRLLGSWDATRKHYGEMRTLGNNVQNIADWARNTHPDLMGLTVNQALYRSRRWHAQFKREQAAKMAPPSDIVYVFGPWSVHALTTRAALEHEGQCQHHCVGGYWGRVQRGETMIFSVRDQKGVSRATLEVRNGTLVQMRGPANREVRRKDLLAAISSFLAYTGFSPGGFELGAASDMGEDDAMRENPARATAVFTGWSCVSGPGEFVEWLVQRGEGIDTREFFRYVPLREVQNAVGRYPKRDFVADWGITWLKSELFDRNTVWVMQHSGIEYLFAPPGADWGTTQELSTTVMEYLADTTGKDSAAQWTWDEIGKAVELALEGAITPAYTVRYQSDHEYGVPSRGVDALRAHYGVPVQGPFVFGHVHPEVMTQLGLSSGDALVDVAGGVVLLLGNEQRGTAFVTLGLPHLDIYTRLDSVFGKYVAVGQDGAGAGSS